MAKASFLLWAKGPEVTLFFCVSRASHVSLKPSLSLKYIQHPQLSSARLPQPLLLLVYLNDPLEVSGPGSHSLPAVQSAPHQVARMASAMGSHQPQFSFELQKSVVAHTGNSSSWEADMEGL